MRKYLNSAFQLIAPLLLIFLSANLSFAQKGMDLQNDLSCTTIDQDINIFPFDNDDFSNGVIDFSSFNIVTAPTQGTAVWDPVRYILTYSPAMTTAGTDQMVYELCNTAGECSTAIIDINIQGNVIIPIVDVFTFATSSFSGNVIANDVVSFSSSNNYDVFLVNGPSNGTVNLQTNGDFTYTQNQAYIGKDYFTYEVCDMTNNICAQTTVALHAMAVPTDPNNYMLINDFGLTFTNNTNFINYLLGRHNSIVNTAGLPVTYSLTSNVTNGNLSFNPNGTFSYITPYNFIGQDEFSYEVCVGTDCVPATVFIEVLPENFACRRHFPVAQNNTIGVCDVEELNDNFKFNDMFYGYFDDTQISILTGPENGVLSFDQDGNFTYLPNFDYNGIDRIEYEICEQDISIMTYDYSELKEGMVVPVGGATQIIEEPNYITDAGVIADLSLSVQFKHDALEELQINLIDPNGTVIPLFNNICSGGGDLHLIFSDAGTTNVDCSISTAQIIAPLTPLASLINTSIQGEWNLQMIDLNPNSKQGVLTSWGMESSLNASLLRDCRTAWIEIPVINKNQISLDLELLDFTAIPSSKNSVDLRWVSNEYGEAESYLVERSVSGASQWESLHKLSAQNLVGATYAYTDRNLAAGKYYYRLVKLENSGAQFFSDVKTVDILNNRSRGLISNFGHDKLLYNLPSDHNSTVEIFDAVGKRVFQTTSVAQLEVDIQNFQAGMYISVIRIGEEITTEKFYKN